MLKVQADSLVSARTWLQVALTRSGMISGHDIDCFGIGS